MSAPTDDVTAAGPLGKLFDDPRIRVAEMAPEQAAPDAGLYPEEAAAVASAVLSRRQQFAAGRRMAREAWQRLGVAPQALLNDEQRVPVWPAEVVGTITHTQRWCAAAVARKTDVAGLGADVEPATPLERNLWERICRPEERRYLESMPAELRGLLAKGIFSAKESIYKALYPRVRVFLDFQGMHVALAPGASPGLWSWQATLQVDWGPLPRGRRFDAGRLQLDPQLISSAIVLSNPWPG